MTTTERRQIESLKLVNGCGRTTTSSGLPASIYQNDTNINRPYFQLIIAGKTVFTRGTIARVIKTLNDN